MRFASLALVAFALSGCAAPPADDTAATPDLPVVPDPDTIPWGLTDCRFLIGIIRFDPDLGADLLPDGFAYAVGDGLPLPTEVEPVRRATLGVEAFDCRSGAGLDGEVAPLAYGSFYFDVIPPETLHAGDGVPHYLKYSVLVPDGPRRAWLEASGADVTAGSVVVSDGPEGRSATLKLEDVGEIRYRSVTPREGDAFDGFRFREFTPARDGLVVWDASASTPGTFSGEGVLEVPDGSIPARLLGATTARVPMFGGVYTFSDATVSRPSGP